jgi:hypothetical protein
MKVFASLGALLLAQGCATAKLIGDPPVTAPDPGRARNVVIEPLFELAQLQTSTRTEYARLSSSPYMGGFGSSGFGSMGTTTVAITRQVQEKPFFAKAQTLVEVQNRVLHTVQRLRPTWRVSSTGGAAVFNGDVAIIRTIIEGNELVASDRTLKNLSFGFGLVIWPLQFINLNPVEETVRVFGLLERFTLDSAGLPTRLVKYPSQPDYAVNLAGVPSNRHEFGLDVSYSEGLLASELPRSNVLIDGFVDRLAAAVVAIVEETP